MIRRPNYSSQKPSFYVTINLCLLDCVPLYETHISKLTFWWFSSPSQKSRNFIPG